MFALVLLSIIRGQYKEKVDISGEKGAQISLVIKKIVTQGRLEIMIIKYRQA